MPSQISLLIAHSKELIRAGVRAMLANSGIRIVGEAENAPSALTLAKKHKPSVMLLEAAIRGGDAFDLVRELSKPLAATKFVLLSAFDNPTYMARARAVGAANCLLKDVSQKDLVTAIENAAAGKPVKSGPYAEIVRRLESGPKAALGDASLTPRESQVLSHVAYGLSNDEISRTLDISVETVKEHVQNMLRKLEVRDRTQAAVWAVQRGLA
jgi:DNA-binding NarL/FixJ family response regulator